MIHGARNEIHTAISISRNKQFILSFYHVTSVNALCNQFGAWRDYQFAMCHSVCHSVIHCVSHIQLDTGKL